MAYEQKEGQGAMFSNDKKGNEKAPDFKGTVLINGELMDIAAWKKTSAKGEFLSITQKPKQAKNEPF